jgi:hypothetical protein
VQKKNHQRKCSEGGIKLLSHTIGLLLHHLIFDISLSTAGLVRGVDIDALYLASKILLQGFKGKQIVPMYQHIAAIYITVGVFGVFYQYP